jgi:retron-type reverse transcriptase
VSRRLRAWDRIIALDHLWRAWEDYAQGKRRRPSVATFALDASTHILLLARELEHEVYQPRAYRTLRIAEPKHRLIAVAAVRDRVVQRAIYNAIGAPFERALSAQSFACLRRRGTHRALIRCLGQMRTYRYVLSLDIRAYFDSIDHHRLRTLLFKRIIEPPLRRLVDTILASGDRLHQSQRADPQLARWIDRPLPAPGYGLPIGNLTSQWWANLYLGAFDHEVQRSLGLAYQRYMDDLLIFGNDRDTLLAARDTCATWLARERKLDLKHPLKRPTRTDQRLHYLGYVVSRCGLEIGPASRSRLYAHLRRHAHDPARFRSALAALTHVWLF